MRLSPYLYMLITAFGVGALTAASPIVASEIESGVEIPRSGEFELSVFEKLEELNAAPGTNPTPQTIASSQFADRFKPSQISGSFINDEDKWFRFRVQNTRNQEVRSVLMTRYFFGSIKIVQTHAALGHTVYRQVGYQYYDLNAKSQLMQAETLIFPPGESTIYLALNSYKHPTNLHFQIRSEANFDRYNQSLIARIAAFLALAVSLVFINAALMFNTRSLTMVYFLVMSVGLMVLQTLLSGAMNLNGGMYFAASIRLWFISLAVIISSAGLFVMKFLDVPFVRFRRLYNLHFFNSVGIIAASLLSAYTWPYSLSLTALSLAFLMVVIGWSIAFTMVSNFRRALIFLVCSLPILVFGAGQLLEYFQQGNLPESINYFWGSSLASLVVMMTFAARELLGSERKTRALAASLQSVFPPLQVQRIVSERLQLDQGPQERYVTVMFIDIVGYSIAARTREQMQTFHFLKDTLGFISKIVHKHGGIIDKSLGDGSLCFFGYNFAGKESNGHERIAVKCALEIQRQMVDRINSLPLDSGDVFPLRIGINSALICIGNMGDENRFDFTLHGDGVNMAQRFESACEPFKVTIGKSTYEALDEATRMGERFYQRYVPIKNAAALVEAYEVNPFEKDSIALDQARGRYWKSIGVQRVDHRYVPKTSTLMVKTSYGDMILQNFSLNGFCVKSRIFLGKGAELTLDLSQYFTDPALSFLGLVTVQVRWGVPSPDDQFILGTLINGLSDQHRELVFDNLVKAAERQLAAIA